MEKVDKKIAFFFHKLGSGGIEKVFFILAKNLSGQGFDVDYVLIKNDLQFAEMVDTNEINVVYLNCPVLLAPLYLARYIRKNKPNAVISGYIWVNVIAIIAGIVSGRLKKIIITEHSLLNKILNNPSIIKRLAYKTIKYFYFFADRIIVCSKGIENELRGYWFLRKARVNTIYNPAFVPEIVEKASEEISHKWLNEKYKVVLACGRLHFQKNYPVMLKSFSMLRDKVDNARLIIIGIGEEEEKLKTLAGGLSISEEVDFIGFQKNPFAYMARADVFCLSSDFEGLPTVLIEALGCGCAIVSTNCETGPAEILENGKYGTLVPVGDKEALAAALEDVLLGKVKYDKESLKKRAEDFSVDKIMPQYMEVLFGKE